MQMLRREVKQIHQKGKSEETGEREGEGEIEGEGEGEGEGRGKGNEDYEGFEGYGIVKDAGELVRGGDSDEASGLAEVDGRQGLRVERPKVKNEARK